MSSGYLPERTGHSVDLLAESELFISIHLVWVLGPRSCLQSCCVMRADNHDKAVGEKTDKPAALHCLRMRPLFAL